MADSFLSFVNSESFRNSLITRNLSPYTVSGSYTPPSGPQNYEFSASDSNVINSPDGYISQNPFVRSSQTLNEFGPNNGYQQTIINNNLPVTPNQGEYNPNDTALDLVNEFYIDNAYIENRYGPVGGFNNMVVIDSIQNNNRLYVPYWNPPTFIPSSYSPYNILLSNNPTGSDGLLSQDSYIAKIGAEFLKDAIQARIDAELYQRTLGSVNLGSLSDPFEASLVATGKEPLIYRDYRITVPENPVTAGAELTLRLTGAYLPFSLIPGDYFLENLPSAGSSTQTNRALNVTNQLTGGFLGPILNKTRNPSEIFLANTGNGQRSVLFQTINYNKYQPFYERGFGQLLQGAIGSINPANGTLVGGYYVGSKTSEPSTITSPPNQIPVDASGRQVQTDVYGPSELGILYEGNQNQLNFGLGGKSTSNGGGIVGQFVWTSPKYKGAAGYKATPGGGIGSIDGEYNEISSDYTKNESTNITFKQDSILDRTQRLIESADNVSGIAKLKHVGNAINQVSKVFNDGYKEITKGSRVLSYKDNTTGEERGIEYCRIFTKDTPYYTYSDLQKTDGITTSGRRFSNSVFDNTFNLNIAPIKGEGSTNIKKDAKGNFVAKKYMFSIENLAWRTSSRPGFTYDDLPVCEKGPNGGRVMWFPPYNLKFSDSSTADFGATNFLGRPEPIYTYKNTSRKGSVSWTIIVDNPSITNLLVDKQLKGKDSERVNSIMDSFFAGCVKYDIYELAKKFNTIPLSELYTYQEILNNPRLTSEEYQGVVKSISKDSSTSALSTEVLTGNEEVKTKQTADSRGTDLQKGFQEYAFYFDDNIPGPNSGKVSNQPYQSTYETYVSSSNTQKYQNNANAIFGANTPYCVNNVDYCSRAKNTGGFFDLTIKSNYEKITKEFIPKVFEILKENTKNTISMEMVGSASALGETTYNLDLSERRLDSIIQFFKTYNSGDINLKPFIENKQLTLKLTPEGEGTVIPKTNGGENGFEVTCTQNIIGGTGVSTTSSQIYSVNAMACRRVKIKVINTTIEPKQDENESLPREKNKEEETVIKIKPIPRLEPNVDVIQKVKDGIGKKILRNLLTECDYFELIEEKAPMVYSSFKEKIKYFNPAFHSMTPEGLNSRLTFLNQCVRPGETIPIIGTDGRPKYNDAINTAFGTPPILVLRIGDFFHTKIVPGSVSFSYEPITFDINPEGIGIQPMMVNVTLDFNIIGGMGLKEPIEQLQNALSFNYYANTEIYDDRATPTEDTSALDKQIVEALDNTQPTVKSSPTQQPNPGGTTIGTITTNIPILGGQSGETTYQQIMDSLLSGTRDYFNLVVNKLESTQNTYNYGVVQLLDVDRFFNTGEIKIPNNKEIEIYGKPNFEQFVTEAFGITLDTIESGSNIIITGLTKFYTGEKTPIPLVKENLKKYIKNLETSFSNGIATIVQELSKGQQDYVQIIRKLNLVVEELDGKLINPGEPRVYKITPTTEIYPQSSGAPTNTMEELIYDYKTLVDVMGGVGLDGFFNLLDKYKIAFTKLYNEGNFNVFLENNSSLNDVDKKIFFMLMGRILTDNNKKRQFIDSIITGELKTWKDPVKLINKFEKIVDDLANDYKKELDKENENFKKLRKDKKFKDLTEGLDALMYQPKKIRKFTYETIAQPTEVQKKSVLNLYNSTNEGDFFNKRNTF